MAESLDVEAYRFLQLRLVAEPDEGDLIAGTGGLRKVRWQGSGRGKSGGVRVIYYWAPKHNVLLMLLICAKNERDDPSADQKKVLAALVKEELK